MDQSLHDTGNEANQTKGNDQTIERKDGAAIYCLTHNAIGCQAESELKCQKNEAPVSEPMKATPQFETSNISQSIIK